MTKHLINLVLVFMTLNAIAQTSYQRGYVVVNNKDTIKGFINYNEQKQLIIVKTAAEDKVATSFTPADLKSFFIVPDNKYISYLGRVSNNKNHLPDIDADKDTTTSVAALFLRQGVSGPDVTLYTNADRLKTRFFYKVTNGTPVELLYYQYGKASDNPHIIPVFTDQLKELFNKYNTAGKKKLNALQSTEFTQGSLEAAFNLINNTVIEDQTPPELKLVIGAGIASVTSTADNILGSVNAKNTSLSPRIGLALEFMGDPDVQKGIFRMELSFSYLKPNFAFSYSPNGLNTINGNSYSFSQYMISFTPQFLINIYNTAPLKFFVGAGVTINYSIYQNSAINYYTIYSFSPYTLKPATDNSTAYSAMQGSFPIQAGIVLNNAVEVAINYSPKISGESNLTFQSFGAGVHYRFK